MQLSKNLQKISWTAADKSTYALFGIASIVLLRITDGVELGLFTLFLNLHNFILGIAYYLGLQALLHFSARENEKAVVNTFSILNCAVATILLMGLVYLFQIPLSAFLNEERITIVASSIPLLCLLSIPRYFMVFILYRELQIFRLFLLNLTYFGTMSGIIFYNVWRDTFLNGTDLINITYIGSCASILVGLFLTGKYLRFRLATSNTIVRYKEVVKYSATISIGGIAQTLPRMLDVYFVQFFFGLAVVGLYAPAKTIFRFVEDLINAIYSTIYSPTVKYFANDDIIGVNKIITKSVSFLVTLFASATLFCWLGGDSVIEYILPEKFVNSISILNYLLLASIFLPFTLINSVINANGYPQIVAKYILFGVVGWFISFALVGTFFNETTYFIALPYIVYSLILMLLTFCYARKHYHFKFKQIFRLFSDGYFFFYNKVR